MLSALVVDADAGSRARLAGLLQLTGWQVLEAAGRDEALQLARTTDADLVVTEARLHDGDGSSLLRRLRAEGCRARFLVVTDSPTPRLRADAARTGALACLAKPVDEQLLLDFLRGRATGPAAQGNFAVDVDGTDIRELEDLQDADVDAELMDRLQEMYATALPSRLGAIARGARSGDAPALAWAAHTLAGTSGQLGHPEVASVCQAIARDARRGILAHSRVVQLQALVGA